MYDAVGNITQKRDDNIPLLFYNNAVISSISNYTYDAMYRLIQATGREKLATATFGLTDNWDNTSFITQHNPNDNMAIQSYTQFYTYDPVGNILQLKHVAGTGSYNRNYNYSTSNNRLLGTSVGSDAYTYTYHPQHGFITSMPHLPVLRWNFKEEIAATSRQSVNTGTPETTYYQYDSQGTRLRKITENYAAIGNTPSQKNARIYIAGYEFYENYTSGDQTRTLSLIDQGNRFVMIENSSTYGLLTRYQHPNHQSSAAVETNENGDLITYEEYHPFGTTAYQATNATITASAKRYRYTGMERDEETGLSYHNARYYVSWLGRWMNCDPIGIGDGVNVYAYCENNPVANTDKEGTQIDEDSNLGKLFYLVSDANVKEGTSNETIVNNNTILKNPNNLGIPTIFYDENGLQTDAIPEVVQKMFQDEYGITLGYEGGKLFKLADYKTELKVSPSAKAAWEKELGFENTQNSLVFGYNLALSALPGKEGLILDNPVIMGVYSEAGKTAFIDLADFDSSGKILGSTAIAVSDTDINFRSDNLARVMEHEFLGHGAGLGDTGYNGLGEVENQLNIWRKEVGLSTRDSYKHVS
jgi:RHS repeat-associated protein